MVYTIDENAYKRADDLGVIIKKSTKKYKKIDVFDKQNNYMLSIGDTRYEDYRSYIKTKGLDYANERKRLYNIRHKKTKDIKGSPSFFANEILWK